MKVSIITVSFNAEKTIRDTIESVLSQAHDDIEYIIVDGLSTDGTVDIIKEYDDRISKWVTEADRGLYDAMNKGISMATGEVVGILNADDIYMDGQVVPDIVHHFDTEPLDAFYGDLMYVKEENIEEVVRYWRSGTFDREAFLKGWMPPHPTFFVTRACYQRFGTYDISFKTSADYELMLRFLFKNYVQAGYIERVLVKMRTGGQSNASFQNRIDANKEDRRAWEVNGIKPRSYTLTMKPLRKLGQFFAKYRSN